MYYIWQRWNSDMVSMFTKMLPRYNEFLFNLAKMLPRYPYLAYQHNVYLSQALHIKYNHTLKVIWTGIICFVRVDCRWLWKNWSPSWFIHWKTVPSGGNVYIEVNTGMFLPWYTTPPMIKGRIFCSKTIFFLLL